MRPFIIDNDTRDKLISLRIHAMANPYSLMDLIRIGQGLIPPPGDIPEFVRWLHFGYRVVFTYEGSLGGPVKHLSVSVSQKGKLPAPEVIVELMGLLGFESKDLKNERLTIFEVSGQAINVIEQEHKRQ